jgi:hypothetical protein
MRADEFIREEEKLDEVLPLVGLAAKGVGGALAKGAAKGVGGALAKGVGGALAKGAAKGVGGALAKGAARGAAGAVGRGLGRAVASRSGPVGRMAGPGIQQNQTDGTMGAPDDQNAAPTDPARAQALDRAKDQIIKPGANVNLPTDGTGGPGEFKISGIQGDEVEIENPNPAPGEPRKIIHKKDDIKQSMSL